MKKLAVTSLAALTLSLAAASGAQAIERLPIVKLAPPATTVVGNASPTVKRLPCSTCDYRPPVGRYPPGYTPPVKKADLPPPGSDHRWPALGQPQAAERCASGAEAGPTARRRAGCIEEQRQPMDIEGGGIASALGS